MLILHNDKKLNINKKKICNTKLHIFDKDAFLSCQKSSSPFYSSVLSVSLPESPSCHPDTKNKVTVLQNLCTVPSVLACRVSSGLLGSWAAPCVGHVRPALPPRTATPSCTWLHKRSNTQHKKAKQQNKNQNITLVVVGIQQKKQHRSNDENGVNRGTVEVTWVIFFIRSGTHCQSSSLSCQSIKKANHNQ